MTDSFSPKPKENVSLSAEAREAISKKTEELYEKRIAPYAQNLSPEQKQVILNFQQLVFAIDYYFEHNRDVNQETLDSFWKQAENFLAELGMGKSLTANILMDIKGYAEVEASTRKGKKLADRELENFYFLKSCDVRMQRHLVRYLNNDIPDSSEPEIKKDILEEIEDDVDDLEEDKNTPFNGNRLLEILKSKNIPKLEEYIIYINSSQNPSSELVRKVQELVDKFKAELRRLK